MKSFAGKVAAITGAGSGMGRALAESLARQGCHVAICDINAGVSVTDTVMHLSYSDFEWLMGINFWGVVYGTKDLGQHCANPRGIRGYL